MNLPNQLTLSRIIMIPCIVFFLLAGTWPQSPLWQAVSHWAALTLFIVASVTDAVDGFLARKYQLITNFGRLADPLADKLLVMSVFVAFVELGMFPAWLVIVILCREFIVTGLRTLGISQQRVIHADWWGKHKTISQMITLITAMLYLALSETLKALGLWHWVFKDYQLEFYGDWLITILIYYALFSTLLSGFIYLYKNLDLLHD